MPSLNARVASTQAPSGGVLAAAPGSWSTSPPLASIWPRTRRGRLRVHAGFFGASSASISSLPPLQNLARGACTEHGAALTQTLVCRAGTAGESGEDSDSPPHGRHLPERFLCWLGRGPPKPKANSTKKLRAVLKSPGSLPSRRLAAAVGCRGFSRPSVCAGCFTMWR